MDLWQRDWREGISLRTVSEWSWVLVAMKIFWSPCAHVMAVTGSCVCGVCVLCVCVCVCVRVCV